MCCWSQATDSAALSLRLLLAGRTGLLMTPAPREPVSNSYQLVSRNIHAAIPASPSSLQQIPQVYNLNLNIMSPFFSENPFEEKKAWLSQISCAYVQFSPCFWPSQLIYSASLHSARDTWHTGVPLHSSYSVRKPFNTFNSEAQSSIYPPAVSKKPGKPQCKAMLSLHYILSCHYSFKLLSSHWNHFTREFKLL